MGGIHLRGTAAAPGIAVGPVWRYVPGSTPETVPGAGGLEGLAPDSGAAPGIRAAAAEAARQLEELADRVRSLGRTDEAAILRAQALMATDTMIVDAAVQRAEAGDVPVVAVRAAATAAADLLASLDDELLAARAADVRDVGARIVRVLTGQSLALPSVPSIALAEDLPPSITAEIQPGFLLGIVLAGGSPTAHAAILARGLGIPAVVGVAGLAGAAGLAGEAVGELAGRAAIDGEAGEVVIDPSAADAQDFAARAAALEQRRSRAAALRDRPCATADGERVTLVANIGTPADVPRALEARAEGVGLFRTEFAYMGRQTPPTENELVEAYRATLAAFGPDRHVVIRLLDVGGDKDIPYLDLPHEANPFLGVRGIRLAYRSRSLILTQLRAIWRAGALAGVSPHVMAPMITTADDVDLFRSLRDEARAGVVSDGLECAPRLVTGIMVEVPAAAMMAAELARMVDFFSVGTNDLSQYLLAADRGNSSLASLQDALHPAVLRTIARVVDGAHAAGIPVAVCGELAGDPVGALVLTGLGVDELSADAGSLDGVRAALSRVTRARLAELGQQAVAAASADEVRQLGAGLLAP